VVTDETTSKMIGAAESEFGHLGLAFIASDL
jgi:hypothetical protein